MRSLTIKYSTLCTIRAIVLTIIVQCITYHYMHAQGRVGIGTNNPQATLHVAGNLRVDTTLRALPTDRIATLDSAGTLRAISLDSLKKQMNTGQSSGQVIFSEEITAQGSTTSSAPQSRVTLTLPPGNYLIFAYAEIFNASAIAGVRMWLFEGSTETGYAMPYSNTSTYGSWSCYRYVSLTAPTVITLSYSAWPGGTVSYIRRARLVALKI